MYLHYALDLWFDKVVKAHCRGEALLCRYADDWVCAFRYQDDAERFYRVLPKRLEKFNLQVAPEKTHLLRFSRFHPSMKRRFTFLGFEFALDARSARRAARQAAHGAQEAPGGLPTDHGMDQAAPAPAGARVLPAAECAATGPLQLLRRARQLPLALIAFSTGPWTVRSSGSIGGAGSGRVSPGSSLPRFSTGSR